jgi:maleate isomerase
MTMVPDYGGRGRLGLLIPSGNTAAEVQFSAARPPGMALHWTRLPPEGEH